MVKLSGLIWRKTLAPTTMLTGTVARLPFSWSRIWPLKVPATRPPPGRLAGFTLTVGVEGAVPLDAEMLSQAPPSDVAVVAVQSSVPVPALRMGRTWGGGGLPLVSMVKDSW